MAERSASQEEKYQNIRELFHKNQLPAAVTSVGPKFDEEEKPYLLLKLKEELTEQERQQLAELDSEDLPLKIQVKPAAANIRILPLKKTDQNTPS